MQKAALLQNMSRAGERGGGCGFSEKGNVQKHRPPRPSRCLTAPTHATLKQVVRLPPTERANLLKCVCLFEEKKKKKWGAFLAWGHAAEALEVI